MGGMIPVMFGYHGRSLRVDWPDGPSTSLDVASGATRPAERRPVASAADTAVVYAALARAGYADAEHHASDINGAGRIAFSPARSLAAVVIDAYVVLLKRP